jgi:hypothetical protein
MIRCDSSSELPGILLGTSWTVRIAILKSTKRKKKKEKRKKLAA